MSYKYFNIIGLMTGTSMDGIDISLVRTNGIDLQRLGKNYFYEYKPKIKQFLLNLLNNDINFNLNRKKILDEVVTREHFKALRRYNIIKDCDLIGFHGQTIYHNPKNKLSIQLGDPIKLAQLCQKNIVFNFRRKDIEENGQGAPLAPIYHKFIIESLNLNLPSCILNIGGVSNLTYWDGVKLIGFDTGPGNALMDNFMTINSNQFYDKDGSLASQGVPNKQILSQILHSNFFKKTFPKSLDRNTFISFYDKLLKLNLPKEETMATLAEFTIETISMGVNILPKKIESIIVTGGGYRNKHLMRSLGQRLKTKIIKEEDVNINFDYLESELIAFLSARSIYDLPYTFPSTTGVSRPLSGGVLYKNHKKPF